MIQVRGVDYKVKKFDDLTVKELYLILQEREEVFALEQGVVYKDLDNQDYVAYHLMGFKHDELVSYCRIIPFAIKSDVIEDIHFGRVLTPIKKRKQGFGIQLINQAIIVCKTLTDVNINIVAQAYLEKFYSGFGFKSEGEPYMYEDILHIDMTLNTQDVNIMGPKKLIYSNLK